MAALAEAVTLAGIALRVPYKRLLWDAQKMEFTNSTEANALVRRSAVSSGMGDYLSLRAFVPSRHRDCGDRLTLHASTSTLNPPIAMRLTSNGESPVIMAATRGSFMILALARLRCAFDL